MDDGRAEPPADSPRDAGPGRGPSRPALALGAVLALFLLAFGVTSTALLTDQEGLPDGQLSTAACFRARVGAVHSGSTTLTGPGTTAVTVPSVVPDTTVVLHTVEAAGADAVDGMVAVELVDATTLELTRNGTGTASVTVAWHLVEYTCGIRVQRGTSAGVTASRDLPIEVTDAGRAFTTVSVAPDDAVTTPGAAQQVTATLPDPTTVRLEAGAVPGAGSLWSWQVVEFVRDADADAEHVTAALGPLDTSTTVTLAAPVDPSRTLLLAGVRSTAGTLEQVAVTAEFVATDQVRLQRTVAGAAVTVELQVVEVLDGTAVQRGNLVVVDTASTATASLPTPLDASRTTVLATGTAWGGAQATGRTSAGVDAIGRPLGRFGLDDPSTVRVTRGRTDGTTTWTYQTVTWGGPSWWDTAYGLRERIEVTTTTAAAPDGYTIPLTFDHAAMVAAGEALASGDDVRVLRYDGATWVELDRVLDDESTWNAADTTIWFRTAAAVASDTTDASYWLYRGNPAAGAPPADAGQVFLATEGFEAGLGAFSERTTGTGWYLADDWSFRRSVTIPAGSVTASLTDVPVLVRVVDPAMGGQAQADGDDLRFTAADGVTPLAHEVESWDPGTGELLAWVRVPSLDPATATGLFLYWGATDAPDQADVRGTWSTDHAGVWHLAEDPTGALPHADDSSAEGRDGVVLGATGTTVSAAAVVGDGLTTAADAERVVVGTLPASDAPFTLSGWATPSGTTGGSVLRLEDAGTVHAALELVDTGGVLEVRASLRDGFGTVHRAEGGALAPGTAGHVAATWDGVRLRAWLDGVVVGEAIVDSRQVVEGVEVAIGGGADSGAVPFVGTLDEVRLETVARDGDWLAAQVANQDDPASFAVVGGAAAGSWFGVGPWAARLPLVVDAAAVDASGLGEDLVDFPLLVSITDPALAAGAAADARDLVVTDEGGAVRLDHEVESWDPGTGELVAWVRVPLLSASLDTRLFLYFDNATAVDQQDPAGVFRADHTAVFHLDDDPTAAP